MGDGATPNVRERTVLVVFDHAGPQPRAMKEIEAVAVNGQVIARSQRSLDGEEAVRLSTELVASRGRQAGHWAPRRAWAHLRTLLMILGTAGLLRMLWSRMKGRMQSCRS